MPPAEPKVLADLLEISQTLASALDIRSALGRVLEHIEQSLGAVSVTIALREADGDDLTVEAAVGAGWQRARRGDHKPGGRITGREGWSRTPYGGPGGRTAPR